MKHKAFCALINDQCRDDCVFNCGHYIAINNGNSTKCELAAFITCVDEDQIDYVTSSIKHLRKDG